MLFSSCDLFSPSDSNYLSKLDAEIAWANAAPVSVTVAIPPGWGTSPQAVRCYDAARSNEAPRAGYPFNVEFTSAANYGFIEWLAFDGKHTLAEIAGMELDDARKESLKAPDVKISKAEETLMGAMRSSVIVKTKGAVTLVPFCDPRPRVAASDPPLINSGAFYSQGKTIRIWFDTEYGPDSLELDAETVDFGPGKIELSAQHAETGAQYSGNIYECFRKPVRSGHNLITIDPIDPPLEHNIYVTVGTKIFSARGHGVSAPVKFSYRIGTQTARNSYNANEIWAIHEASKPSVIQEDFFYQDAPTARDRRLRKNTSGKYELTLFFSVTTSGDVANNEPSELRVAEIDYANLSGGERGLLAAELDCPQGTSVSQDGRTLAFSTIDSTAGTADAVYRQGKSGTVFRKAVYTWTTPPDNGMIRLMVLPYRSGLDGATADTWKNAQSEGRFVTVVLDNLAPGGNAIFTPDPGAASVSGNVYNYNSEKNMLTINADFSNIRDNAVSSSADGIILSAATRDKPWSMDAQKDIEWQYRIVTGTTENHKSAWFTLNNNNQTVNLSTISNLTSSTAVRNLQVKYRDSLGNESPDWLALASLRYYNSAKKVWAHHTSLTPASANDFFYQGADLSRDRRIRLSGATYSVTLYYYIPTSGTMPDRVRIQEIKYATLQGNDDNTEGRFVDLTPSVFTGTTGADGFYRTGVSNPSGVTYYRTAYTWTASQFASAQGILRLAVMPFNSTDTFANSGDSWQAAVEEGRFVTVVCDNQAPDGFSSFTLSGQDRILNEVINSANRDIYVYNSNAGKNILTIKIGRAHV